MLLTLDLCTTHRRALSDFIWWPSNRYLVIQWANTHTVVWECRNSGVGLGMCGGPLAQEPGPLGLCIYRWSPVLGKGFLTRDWQAFYHHGLNQTRIRVILDFHKSAQHTCSFMLNHLKDLISFLREVLIIISFPHTST